MDNIYDPASVSTFNFISGVASMRPRNERHGQRLMNALHGVNSVLYHQITGTDADCFYNDAKIPQFQAYLDLYDQQTLAEKK